MSAQLDEIKSYLSRSRCVTCGETLTLGNLVPTVFRACRGKERLVVKIGSSLRAAQEVRMNCAGYEAMRKIGAGNLVPGLLEYLEFRGVPILVMEDCGPDFWHAVQVAPDPVRLYTQLLWNMEPVYATTRRCGDGEAYLNSLRDRLIRQYETHLFSLVGVELVSELRRLPLRQLVPSTLCFSSFDFTPEDVFLTDKGVKFADPLPEVLGVPIVDLACFGGVARDAHHLPGSEEGYRQIQIFALGELPSLLELTERQAERLFAFGRALQCALSARFRLQSEPESADTLAKMSRSFLQEFMRT